MQVNSRQTIALAVTTAGNPTGTWTYARLLSTMYYLLGVILQLAELGVVAALVWYGLQMVLSRGDAARFTSAKNGVMLAIVGGIIIFGVYTILATVKGAVIGLGGQ